MLNIHPATRNDIPALLSLIRGLAAYEKKPNAVVTTEQDLLRDAFGKHSKFRALIAEWKGEPAGYASFFHFYSTYQGRAALFLEDLFVLDKFRGNGIGMSLLSAVAKLAIDEGCFGLRWEVLDWNEKAIEFYKSLGAEFRDRWRPVLLADSALRKLTAKAP